MARYIAESSAMSSVASPMVSTPTAPAITISAASVAVAVASVRDKDPEREREKEKEKERVPPEALPHPAEDLSADDDLLSWVLVDQLGCMPNTKLGVHPQQVKFVGPSFKTDEVLGIVRETITKGNAVTAMQRLQEFPLLKAHLESKLTEGQRDRFIQHLRRYLLPLRPESRVEIHLTTRYTFVTGHTELAVFATKPLSPSEIMSELQGSVVPLPDQWRLEMEIGEDFAVEAAGEETASESEGEDDASMTSSSIRRDKGKGKEVEGKRQGQRRSDRTKRRDFSIVWSGLKRCYQLFLGPARFLNHDCNPNVELLRQGKFVTFRVIRPIRVGDELTTFYGDNYFGRGNIECLCLTCEQAEKGGFTPVPTTSRRFSRALSRDSSSGPSRSAASPSVSEVTPKDGKQTRPSSLRHVVSGQDETPDSDGERDTSVAGPSRSRATSVAERDDEAADDDDTEDVQSATSIPMTPTKPRSLKINIPLSPSTEATSEPGSPVEAAPRRDRSKRKAAQKMTPWQYLQRPKKAIKASQAQEVDEESTEATDDFPSDFPRCATCAKALTEQIWLNGRYLDHCARCVRHALIFELPWPAHSAKEVREYPPSHLVPSGYIPRKISTVALPSLSKTAKPVKPTVTIPVSPHQETREEKRARKLRAAIEAEAFFVESLREAAWSAQETREAALKAQAEARAEAKRQREEAKRLRNEGKIRGSGVWSRYTYLTDEEVRKREEEKNRVTTGTRRGGRIRADKAEEEELRKLAVEKAKAKATAEREAKAAREAAAQAAAAEAIQRSEQEQAEEADDHDGASTSTSAEIVVSQAALDRCRAQIRARALAEEDNSEHEVSAAPELKTARARSKSTVASKPRASHSQPPTQRGQDTPATPSTVTSAHVSTASQASNVIDLTMSSDADDGEVAVKRKRGRPKGSGKHQRAAAAKLAKQQAAEASQTASAASTSPDIVYLGQSPAAEKVKAKEHVAPSPSLNRALKTFGTSNNPHSPILSWREKNATEYRTLSSAGFAPYATSSAAAFVPRSGIRKVDQWKPSQSDGDGIRKLWPSTVTSGSALSPGHDKSSGADGHAQEDTVAVNGESSEASRAAQAEAKRKRLSDASDASVSPSIRGPEKKKRTFFPSVFALSPHAAGSPPVPAPKHPLPLS
ncbi:hypothetical protein IAU60_002882 [Kwoniella sp. DSM 27419]